MYRPDLIKFLDGQLKPGFSLESNGALWTLYKDGEVVRLPATGQPVRVSGTTGSNHYRRRVVSQLQELGAIPKGRRRSANERHEPIKPKPTEVPNPLLIAREVISDVKSTPRERRLAKEYLNLFEQHEGVMALAARLGQRLKELHD